MEKRNRLTSFCTTLYRLLTPVNKDSFDKCSAEGVNWEDVLFQLIILISNGAVVHGSTSALPDRPSTKRTVWDETKWGGAPAAASPPLPAPLPVDEHQIAEQSADDHAHDIPSSYLGKGAWQIARLFYFLLRCVHAGHTATAAMIWQAKKKSAGPCSNFSLH